MNRSNKTRIYILAGSRHKGDDLAEPESAFCRVMAVDRFLNIAAYHFVELDGLSPHRRELKLACDAANLRGTILLSREGINLFIAGEETRLRSFLHMLTSKPEFADLEVKESWSDHQPFNRMLVRLKTEIISMGIQGIDPRNRPSPKLKAKELKQWLDEGREVMLLDVRNDYEIGVGTFVGAKAIGLDHFRNFPAAVSTLSDDLKDKPVVMFCTGGIRCEKAGPYMQQRGYENVYQLDGGILKYFEECGGAHYEGDCFVFDKRVALNPQLEESGLGMCFVCQAILTPEELASPQYVVEESCPHCFTEKAPSRPSLEERGAAIRDFATPLPGSVPYDNMRPIRIPERCDGATMMGCVMELYGHFGEAFWRDELRLGRIKLGNRVVDAEWVVRSGQRYAHWFPDTVEPDVNVNVEVIYEDDALLVVNKPAPLPMHPSGRFNRNTLTWILREALQMHGLRPVHRLDANTTGVAIFAKTRSVAGDVQRQFDAWEVEKTYLAQCLGVPAEARFRCDAPITRTRTTTGGRDVVKDAEATGDQAEGETNAEVEESQAAETHFVRRRDCGDGSAIVEARPVTGRTNQIRLHLWHLGHPIMGDPTYLPGAEVGETQTLDLPASESEPMRLHAWKVKFRHPQTRNPLELTAPMPTWYATT